MRIAEAQRHELPLRRFVHRVVDLVDRQHHRTVAVTQQAGDAGIFFGDAHRRVDHHHHDLGVADGALTLTRHLLVERVAPWQPSTGVDDRERDTPPRRLELLAVTRDARTLLDDGDPLAHDAIDECRLADVRPTHDGDGAVARGAHREARTSSAARNAAPSVATISTGRGNWSGLIPSRKRPPDKHTSGNR